MHVCMDREGALHDDLPPGNLLRELEALSWFRGALGVGLGLGLVWGRGVFRFSSGLV